MPELDLPPIGLGTFQNTYRDECVESVLTALDVGYRLLDTAQVYDTESFVGEALAESSVDRSAVTLATKIWNDNLGYDEVLSTFEASRDRLGVDVVDLLYVHWPAGAYDPADTLAAFDELYDRGVIRGVGVSNFTVDELETARARLDAPIAANQIEVHPLCPQSDLRAYCADHGIEVVAYSPLARGRVIDVPELREIADERDATAAQVSLAWVRQRGATPIPTARMKRYIEENYASLELELDEEELARIDGIERTRRTIDPEYAPW
jgi:2,5-diketo-D-gluconate reductase B